LKIQGKLLTATKMDDRVIDNIRERFEKLVNAPISFEVEVDPTLLGGFVVVLNNKVYDRSIKSKLDRIKNKILETDSDFLDDLDNIPTDDFKIKFDPDEFNTSAYERLMEYDDKVSVTTVGAVESVGDGVVKVIGLENSKYGEVLVFGESGEDAYGIVMDLDEKHIGGVLLSGLDNVQEGTQVRNTGDVISVPVGKELVSRVINPLGTPIDGKGKVLTRKRRPIESDAPAIIERNSVSQSLETGIVAIDAIIPIGKGQRELIIGDRQTGKTAIAVDTILNQKGKDVLCVYVAIGQKASTVASIVNVLTENGAMDYTVVVASTASDSAPMQYIAPYAGCAIAEEFMYNGRDVLVVYDDLSKHAVAYRAMSLLLRRPPGREAYPGDVFYLHSRLLERAAKLGDKLGGGSMTALPIIETMAGDISAYIPTNVISITDGQIFLESELFNAGIRPAINIGLSVSRVGGDAQKKAMRKVAGPLRLDLSQYKELAVFAQFASDLDESTQEQLNNGVRLTYTLVQSQYKPIRMSDQVILLAMATQKCLLDIPIDNVIDFNREFLQYAKTVKHEMRDQIESTGEITDEQIQEIIALAKEFKEIYKKSKENNAVKGVNS